MLGMKEIMTINMVTMDPKRSVKKIPTAMDCTTCMEIFGSGLLTGRAVVFQMPVQTRIASLQVPVASSVVVAGDSI